MEPVWTKRNPGHGALCNQNALTCRWHFRDMHDLGRKGLVFCFLSSLHPSDHQISHRRGQHVFRWVNNFSESISKHIYDNELHRCKTTLNIFKIRFLTILKIFKKRPFLMVLDLGTSLELNFMQFRIEPTNRRSISRDFEFFENSSKN